MPGDGPSSAAPSADTSAPSSRNLLLRVLSAAILAPLAVAVAYWGSWPFVAFWALAAIAVWWEWVRLIDRQGSQGALILGGCALVLEALLAGSGRVDKALIIILLALFGIAVTATKHAIWIAAGILYASALLIAPVVIRADDQFGFAAILLLFAVVWSADIGGYFGGRALGGPKLAPAISPKKTWSGAIVGTVVSVAAAVALLRVLLGSSATMFVVFVVMLSAVSQAGDLFESAFKRHFDAKDASGLIPGHGGVMDRLDGFIVAALVAAIIGVLRGGLESAGHGVVVW